MNTEKWQLANVLSVKQHISNLQLLKYLVPAVASQARTLAKKDIFRFDCHPGNEDAGGQQLYHSVLSKSSCLKRESETLVFELHGSTI